MSKLISFTCLPDDYDKVLINSIDNTLLSKYDITSCNTTKISDDSGVNILHNFILTHMEQYKAYYASDIVVVPKEWETSILCNAYIRFAYEDNKEVYMWDNNELKYIPRSNITITAKGDGTYKIQIKEGIVVNLDNFNDTANTTRSTKTEEKGDNKIEFTTDNETIAYQHRDLTVNAFKTSGGAVRIEIIHEGKTKYILL